MVMLAAACGDAAAPTAPPSTQAPSTSDPASTSDGPSTSEEIASAPEQPESPAVVTSAVGEGWTARVVGQGIKPVLALDSAGRPGIAWLFEDLSGFIAYAAEADGWAAKEIVTGYFYGPIGLAYDPAGVPHVVYHDHQDRTFQPDKGDLVHASRAGDGWDIEVLRDDGHDGWDSTVAVAPDGTLHAAGIDPAQFDGVDGVEHYELVGGTWEVTAIGSGPAEYEWNVSLAFDGAGEPALTFFDHATQDLRFASRASGAWTIEDVATEGDVGRFSSLAFDADGRAHVSFYDFQGPDLGGVEYAMRDGSGWAVETVDVLDALLVDFFGARRATAVAVTPDGTPLVAYTDQSVLKLAARAADGTWAIETVLKAGERALGQLVSLAVDAAGGVHLATYEVTGRNPLDGAIVYLHRPSS